MKKILCPIDTTTASDRLVQYVGNMAKETKSKVYLIFTETKRKEMVAAGYHSVGSKRLDGLHNYLSGIMKVPSGTVDDVISKNNYKKLGLIADQYDLLVMPLSNELETINTNRLDLIKMLQATLIPMLVVPDSFKYQKINRLLYAYDYRHEPDPPILQLKWLAEWYNVEVRFLSILQSDVSEAEGNRVNEIQDKIRKSWNDKNSITFETIVYPDVIKCLELYLNIWRPSDLLVLSINHRNLLERLWSKSVVKGLLKLAEHPYLIIHK